MRLGYIGSRRSRGKEKEHACIVHDHHQEIYNLSLKITTQPTPSGGEWPPYSEAEKQLKISRDEVIRRAKKREFLFHKKRKKGKSRNKPTHSSNTYFVEMISEKER